MPQNSRRKYKKVKCKCATAFCKDNITLIRSLIPNLLMIKGCWFTYTTGSAIIKQLAWYPGDDDAVVVSTGKEGFSLLKVSAQGFEPRWLVLDQSGIAQVLLSESTKITAVDVLVAGACKRLNLRFQQYFGMLMHLFSYWDNMVLWFSHDTGCFCKLIARQSYPGN